MFVNLVIDRGASQRTAHAAPGMPSAAPERAVSTHEAAGERTPTENETRKGSRAASVDREDPGSSPDGIASSFSPESVSRRRDPGWRTDVAGRDPYVFVAAAPTRSRPLQKLHDLFPAWSRPCEIARCRRSGLVTGDLAFLTALVKSNNLAIFLNAKSLLRKGYYHLSWGSPRRGFKWKTFAPKC